MKMSEIDEAVAVATNANQTHEPNSEVFDGKPKVPGINYDSPVVKNLGRVLRKSRSTPGIDTTGMSREDFFKALDSTGR